MSSWPCESQEEDLEYEEDVQEFMEFKLESLSPNNSSALPAVGHTRPVQFYSLSSGYSSTTSSAISSSGFSSRSPRPPSVNEKTFASLWEDEDDELDAALPPIHTSDYMKTLLCQLATSISFIKTAYARQQTALNPYNMPAIHGRESSAGMAVISASDKAMVEELQRLSHLHSQLALLPRMLIFRELGAEVVEQEKKIDSMRAESQLKRYEGIITRFHDEIRRKDAVAEALKETLAKSMLQREKLQQRVKALEAKVSTRHTHDKGFLL